MYTPTNSPVLEPLLATAIGLQYTPTNSPVLEPLLAIAIQWQQARNHWKLRVLDLAIAQDWLPRMVLNADDRRYIETVSDPVPLSHAMERVRRAHVELAANYALLQELKSLTGDKRTTRALVKAAYEALQA